MSETGTMRVKSGLAEMLKGGVIMDVTTAEQARIVPVSLTSHTPARTANSERAV